MSTITITNPAMTPAFGMLACGHASAVAAGTTSVIFGDAPACLPTTGAVAIWTKRRNVEGSPVWRPPV